MVPAEYSVKKQIVRIELFAHTIRVAYRQFDIGTIKEEEDPSNRAFCAVVVVNDSSANRTTGSSFTPENKSAREFLDRIYRIYEMGGDMNLTLVPWILSLHASCAIPMRNQHQVPATVCFG